MLLEKQYTLELQTLLENFPYIYPIREYLKKRVDRLNLVSLQQSSKSFIIKNPKRY